MRTLAIVMTVMVVGSLATFQSAAADFGSLLDKMPVFNPPDPDATAPADSDAASQPPEPVSENVDPVPGPVPPPEIPDDSVGLRSKVSMIESDSLRETDSRNSAPSPEAPDDSMIESDSSRESDLRSPVPPPEVPDDSVGFRSEESMIESDAERAVETFDPSPPSVEFEVLSQSPRHISHSPSHAGSQASACSRSDCNSPHGHACGTATSVRSQPVPYIYAGPGLPPPASLKSVSRTPECYRGLWDGYAEEKRRRCEGSHAHLHGYCDCHREESQPRHRNHRGAHVEQPRGTCARVVGLGMTR